MLITDDITRDFISVGLSRVSVLLRPPLRTLQVKFYWLYLLLSLNSSESWDAYGVFYAGVVSDLKRDVCLRLLALFCLIACVWKLDTLVIVLLYYQIVPGTLVCPKLEYEPVPCLMLWMEHDHMTTWRKYRGLQKIQLSKNSLLLWPSYCCLYERVLSLRRRVKRFTTDTPR